MTDREQVEEQIRALLATETSGINLSNRLFSPDGLFNQLARTADERQLARACEADTGVPGRARLPA